MERKLSSQRAFMFQHNFCWSAQIDWNWCSDLNIKISSVFWKKISVVLREYQQTKEKPETTKLHLGVRIPLLLSLNYQNDILVSKTLWKYNIVQ